MASLAELLQAPPASLADVDLFDLAKKLRIAIEVVALLGGWYADARDLLIGHLERYRFEAHRRGISEATWRAQTGW